MKFSDRVTLDWWVDALVNPSISGNGVPRTKRWLDYLDTVVWINDEEKDIANELMLLVVQEVLDE